MITRWGRWKRLRLPGLGYLALAATPLAAIPLTVPADTAHANDGVASSWYAAETQVSMSEAATLYR